MGADGAPAPPRLAVAGLAVGLGWLVLVLLGTAAARRQTRSPGRE